MMDPVEFLLQKAEEIRALSLVAPELAICGEWPKNARKRRPSSRMIGDATRAPDPRAFTIQTDRG
jgi:hypothetical protein